MAGVSQEEPLDATAGEGVPSRLRAWLAASWPPEDPPAGDHRPIVLTGSRPLRATPLGAAGRHAVVVAQDATGGRLVVPLVAAGEGWRVARPGDGAAAALLGAIETAAPLADGFRTEGAGRRPGPAGVGERGIGTDQTNESAIVGEDVVVKWIRRPDPARERAPLLLRHLADVGFAEVPAWVGRLVAPDGEGGEMTIALADRYLPGASDGWTWALDALLAHLAEPGTCPPECPARFGARVGRLVAGLHLALAQPSAAIPAPVRPAGATEVRSWHAAARRTLAEALDPATAADPAEAALLATALPVLGAHVDAIAQADGVLVQPVHGDLHLGQILQWRDGLAVIDFDGNPVLPADEVAAPQPAARDLAGLLCSLDHLGRIAIRRSAPDREAAAAAWIAGTIAEAEAAYRATLAAAGRDELLDHRLLAAFRAEQECRELLYAERFLPRWRYAPIGAIRAMVER